MANSNKKGANKAQGNRLSKLVTNADSNAVVKTIVPADGRHIVFLKKISFMDVTKNGVVLENPLIRMWLGVVGKNAAFNVSKFLNSDFESDPATYEGANKFLEYLVGAIITPVWAAKNGKKVDFDIDRDHAREVVDLLELCRKDRGTRSFVVETATDDEGNTRLRRIEARQPKDESKSEPKGKAPSKGKAQEEGNATEYV